MSNLNEAFVEDAALTWFGELGYVVGHPPCARTVAAGRGRSESISG